MSARERLPDRHAFALQHGADIDAFRRALGRDSQGRALGPIAEALDRIVRRS